MKAMLRLRKNKDILLICCVIYFCVSCQQKTVTPAKMMNIKAHWAGGIDGGHWFELVKIKGDTIRFRIYNDYTLEKIVDADFVGDGCLDYLKKENWSDYISGYDGINIHLIVVKNYKNLKLYKLKTYYEDCYE